MDHISLVFNNLGADIEVEHIRALTSLLYMLLILNVTHITVYDREGIFARYSLLVIDGLKRKLG